MTSVAITGAELSWCKITCSPLSSLYSVYSINIHNIENNEEPDKCIICLESLENEPQYKLPECNHSFHQNCIMHWFRDGNNKCPLCNNLGVNDYTNQSTTGTFNTSRWYESGKYKYSFKGIKILL